MTTQNRMAAVVMALAAFSAAGATGGINSDYNIRGDRTIAPIQAFDDGQRLYLQLRRTDVPPAPIDTQSGRPLSFVVDGPYLIIPTTPASVTLRYGKREAVIFSTTKPGQGSLGPAPKGGGLWYGNASPAAVTPPATDPIPAAAAQRAALPVSPQSPAPVAPAPVASAPVAPAPVAPAPVAPAPVAPAPVASAPAVVKGTFEVAASHPKSAYIAHKIKFVDSSLKMSAAEIVDLSKFVQAQGSKALVIEAPSGTDGEKRAAEVRRQLMRLGVKDALVSTEIGAMSQVQVLAKG